MKTTQESIWTALSRQQRQANAARAQSKRLANGNGDGDERVRDEHVTIVTVVKKKRRTLDTMDIDNDGDDASVLTDGELFSSQEEPEQRETDGSVPEAPVRAAGAHAFALDASPRGTSNGSSSMSSRDDVTELRVRLSQNVVIPEKCAALVNDHIAAAGASMFTPRTAKTRLHEKKAIKDDVHGLIEFEPICMRIIDTLQFQRLRNLHQLGAANFVYIGATHSRFEHCLGVAYLAETMVETIRAHQPWLPITSLDVLCIKIAGLCHDLGHGPFSHVFDGIFIKALKKHRLVGDAFAWTHEQGSLDMLDHLLASNHIDVADYGLGAQDVEFIKELIYGGPLPGSDGRLCGRPAPEQRFLYDFVNNAQSGLDVDKLDYFLRDAAHAGVKSSCDTQLLIQSARVLMDRGTGKLCVCFPEKLACQVMRAFHTRFELHQSVYQHKSVRAIEYMICDVLLAANDHVTIKGTRISDIVSRMEAYQHLDDRVLARVQESDAPELAAARRILNRIFTKPYYQYVGKTLVTDHSRLKTEAMLTHEILSCATKRSVLNESSSVIVEFLRIHFGKGAHDPLRHVRFYSKNASAGAICYQIPPEVYEMHSPRTFQEHSIRVFVKEPHLVAPVREAFEVWSLKFNRSLVSPMPTTCICIA